MSSNIHFFYNVDDDRFPRDKKISREKMGRISKSLIFFLAKTFKRVIEKNDFVEEAKIGVFHLEIKDLMAGLILKKDLIFVIGNTSFLSKFTNKISKNSDKENIRELFYQDPKVYDTFSFTNQWLEKKSEVYFINIQDLENSTSLINELKNLIELHIESPDKEMFKRMVLISDCSGSIDDRVISEELLKKCAKIVDESARIIIGSE